MVGVRTFSNLLQKIDTIIRGGVWTGVGSGASSEAAIGLGGWGNYRSAVGHRGLIRGTLVLNSLGTNTFLEATVFDTVNGRIIPVARVDANNTSVNFETEVDRDFIMGMRGDNAANDGSCEIITHVQEVPA